MSNPVDPETLAMLQAFVAESLDALDENEPKIELLAGAGSGEVVNDIFRVFHTIKGLAGFLDLAELHDLTHEAETLLDVLRRDGVPADAEVVDVTYVLFDALRRLLHLAIAQDHDAADALDAGAEARVVGRVRQITARLRAGAAAGAATAAAPSAPAVDAELLERFMEEAADLLVLAEQSLLTLEKEPGNRAVLDEAFRAVHSLKGNAGFLDLPDIERTSMEIESILDAVRDDGGEIFPGLVTVLLDNLEEVKTLVDGIATTGSPASGSAATGAPAPTSPAAASPEDEGASAARASETSPAAESEAPAPAPEAAAEEPAPERRPRKRARSASTSIRVDTGKLDELFNLVGELLTVETMVVQNPDLEGLDLPGFQRAAGMLSKLTRELQEVTLAIRMTPIESLFNKMRRLVRDVSRRFDKEIDFEVYGQETEMDKNIIEEISDPLVHLLRNAIDHGVEAADARVAAGKAAAGHIRLGARYEGSEILIVIEDDGAGLDRERILRKAIEKGIAPPDAERLSDREVFALIFEPGFSTADTITDISGRGVGMDVVRRNIEKMHGTIQVDSRRGRGTRFTLRLPLTLAITDAMLVRVGASRYAVPLTAIRESFRPRPDQITRAMDETEIVRVRDEFFPVIRLHEHFGVEPARRALDEGILLVVAAQDRRACLFVDDILGQQQAVMKGLSNYIGRVDGVTGCIILHDGEIGLTLDVDALIESIDPRDAADAA